MKARALSVVYLLASTAYGATDAPATTDNNTSVATPTTQTTKPTTSQPSSGTGTTTGTTTVTTTTTQPTPAPDSTATTASPATTQPTDGSNPPATTQPTQGSNKPTQDSSAPPSNAGTGTTAQPTTTGTTTRTPATTQPTQGSNKPTQDSSNRPTTAPPSNAGTGTTAQPTTTGTTTGTAQPTDGSSSSLRPTTARPSGSSPRPTTAPPSGPRSKDPWYPTVCSLADEDTLDACKSKIERCRSDNNTTNTQGCVSVAMACVHVQATSNTPTTDCQKQLTQEHLPSGCSVADAGMALGSPCADAAVTCLATVDETATMCSTVALRCLYADTTLSANCKEALGVLGGGGDGEQSGEQSGEQGGGTEEDNALNAAPASAVPAFALMATLALFL